MASLSLQESLLPELLSVFMARFVNRCKKKISRSWSRRPAHPYVLHFETCCISQTDRNMATEPAHTVSKADGTVYQVPQPSTRKDSQKRYTHTYTRTHKRRQ